MTNRNEARELQKWLGCSTAGELQKWLSCHGAGELQKWLCCHRAGEFLSRDGRVTEMEGPFRKALQCKENGARKARSEKRYGARKGISRMSDQKSVTARGKQ